MQSRLLISLLMTLLAGAGAYPATGTAAPAGAARDNSHAGLTFRVEIADVTPAAFKNVSGLDSDTDVVEYRSGGEPGVIHKAPGDTHYANIVLSATPGSPVLNELWAWRKAIIDGTVERRDGTVIVLDQSGGEVVRYNFFQAWPCKWSGPTEKEGGTETPLEKVELAVERIERQ